MLSASDPNAAEQGLDTGTFTITRDQGGGDLVVYCPVPGPASSADYQETLSGSVAIADTRTSATIAITSVGDSRVEGRETVVLTLGPRPGLQHRLARQCDALTVADDGRSAMQVNLG